MSTTDYPTFTVSVIRESIYEITAPTEKDATDAVLYDQLGELLDEITLNVQVTDDREA